MKTFLAFILFFVALSFFMGSLSPHPNAAAPIAAKPSSPAEQIHWQASLDAAARLKNAARNPDSFRLVHADYMDDGAVCYQYRAQNGFGGMGMGNAVFTPDAHLFNDDSSRFRARWHRYCAHRTGVDKADGINIALNLLGGN